jgi:cytochrome c-type biogenesis protein CcmF
LRGASAQRSLSGGSWIAALGKVTARNRRRYGGYTVHAGIAILFLAVAASSSFQKSSDMRLRPGESGTVGDYTVTYVSPTSSIDTKQQSLNFGSLISVDRDGKQVALLAPSRNYYSSTATEGTIRGFFEGEATSEVGRQTKFGGDIWSAMRPDLTRYNDFIDGADRRIDAAVGNAPFLRSNLQGIAIQNLADQYRKDGPPVDFRVNVNPFVSWIWVGGAIGVIGALIAIWPAPDARRRRVSDVYAARLARDLGRA